MATLKYIIIEHGGLETPIIFGETIAHKEIYHSGSMGKIVSAGMVNFTAQDYNCEPRCFGRSDTLNVDSRYDADNEVIKRFSREY